MSEEWLRTIALVGSIVMFIAIFIKYYKENTKAMHHAVFTFAAVAVAGLSMGYDVELRKDEDGVALGLKKQIDELTKKTTQLSQVALAAQRSSEIAQKQLVLTREETKKTKAGLVSIMSAVQIAEKGNGQKSASVTFINPEKWKEIQNNLVVSGVLTAADIPKVTSFDAHLAKDPYLKAQRESLMNDKKLQGIILENNKLKQLRKKN